MAYLIGDTISLKVSFKDSVGVAIDVDSVDFTIYDQNRDVLETNSLTADDRINVGEYVYNYTIPDGEGPLIVEFKGMKDGSPTVERQQLEREFIKPMY